MKYTRLNNIDKLKESQYIINSIKDKYGLNEYQTELLEDNEDNNLFNIEAIIDHKIQNNRPMLQVKWHGDTMPTWEKLASIKRVDPLMTDEYIHKHKLQAKIWQLKWARRLIFKLKSTQIKLQDNIDIQSRQSKRMKK